MYMFICCRMLATSYFVRHDLSTLLSVLFLSRRNALSRICLTRSRLNPILSAISRIVAGVCPMPKNDTSTIRSRSFSMSSPRTRSLRKASTSNRESAS